METIESIVKFLSLYPRWAKLLIVGCISVIGSTLIYAPRSLSPDDAQAEPISPKKAYVLVISNFFYFRPGEPPTVRVTAFVNGAQFRYPSLGGVEWVKISDSMAPETFRLPRASSYEIRLEMERLDPSGSIDRFVSQQTIVIEKSPESNEYEVYPLDRKTNVHGGDGVASISFTIKDAP